MTDNRSRQDHTHRLDEALKQIRLVKDRSDDESIGNDLEQAATLVESAKDEIRSLRDG